ncbi:PREDICTED: gap junction delta-2 protein-like [Sturnus vulgaris]|uniref:gap junction delta-2 protein-like n=1 Tax=Sturnus vulgaris TaxID=9172 RepID=UPI00071A5BAE|nr:PREDICTED: gap junction delta-2 protein-like [Sturnus vulgaris]
MGEWTILERLLEAAVQQHSTMIGRILLTVVVIFRILIVAIVGETVYEDEQSMYGFNVPAIFECDRYPCVKEVECYVSRPTEKSVFLVFMFAVSGVCVLLNLAELNHLGWRKVRAAVRGARARRKSLLGDGRRKEPAPAPAPALGRTQSSESAYV